MSLRRLRTLVLVPLLAGLSACGSQGIEVASSDPEMREAAKIFDLHCSGCHSMTAAGAQGSASDVFDREYKDGPNFNQRKEDYEQVLYAIRNGGFSSGPMPQNIVTGREAELVAKFVEQYSGNTSGGRRQAPNPGNAPAAGRE